MLATLHSILLIPLLIIAGLRVSCVCSLYYYALEFLGQQPFIIEFFSLMLLNDWDILKVRTNKCSLCNLRLLILNNLYWKKKKIVQAN